MTALRLGMVGGGAGSFVGGVHRTAAAIDGRYRLTAAAPSRDAAKAAGFAEEHALDPARVHHDWRKFAADEAARDDGIDVVAIVTPNRSHHEIAKTFLEAGINAICDKPLATSLEDARDLHATALRTGRLLGVTYNYSGYPMVREARALIAAGTLGPVRLAHVSFLLGWMANLIEGQSAQAAWRVDPEQAGPSLIVGDLGTHALHLAEFVSGTRVSSLAADLTTFLPGRALEDNAHLLLRLESGARGTMRLSSVAAGENVGLSFQIYGEKGHVAWHQEQPETLTLALAGEAKRTLVRGGGGLGQDARDATRTAAGLPEGFLEAFANLYTGYADRLQGKETSLARLAPLAEAGVRGAALVETALASHAAGSAWTEMP